MRYEQFPPHPSLAPWVECHWRLTGGPDRPTGPQRILPDGSTEIILHLGDPFLRLPDAAQPTATSGNTLGSDGRDGTSGGEGGAGAADAEGPRSAAGVITADAWLRAGAERQASRLFVGQMTRPLRVQATGRTCVWGIRLHPWAGAAVAGLPAHELTDRIACSDDVCPRLARALSDALLAACGDGAIDDVSASADQTARGLRALDDVLHRHLQGVPLVDPLVVAASRTILRQSPPIAGVARRLGVTRRHLERAFQQAVGLTPKMLARIARFQRVAAVLDGGSAAMLAAVALDCGYYDQSHLVRDVRAFAGDTPVALRDALDGELAEYFLRGRRASHFSKIDRATAE